MKIYARYNIFYNSHRRKEPECHFRGEKHNCASGGEWKLPNIIDDDNDYKVAGHTSPTAEETVFFEPFLDLDLALGEEGRLVQAEAKAAIQMVSYC